MAGVVRPRVILDSLRVHPRYAPKYFALKLAEAMLMFEALDLSDRESGYRHAHEEARLDFERELSGLLKDRGLEGLARKFFDDLNTYYDQLGED